MPVSRFKRTKIIATVGPSTSSYKSILSLMKAGVNGFRLNFSHGSYEEFEQWIAWIRKASLEYGKPVSIIQDLQGPKIRLGDFEGIVNVQTGQSFVLGYKANHAATGHIPTQVDLSNIVKRGERLYIFDGRIRTTVTSVGNGLVHVRAENDGVLVRRKGINLPDTDLKGDIITTKDRRDIAFGANHDIDYVALSFVQRASDVVKLKMLLKNLGSQAKSIAKIETRAAADNIEEIVDEADMVMVARGDLTIEIMPERVPILQRQIVELGLRYTTPTIVATQMLASMVEMPEPTRAEVSDVATAVILGADCVMLSDETASGRYPIESVDIMKRVILYSQDHYPLDVTFDSQVKPNNNVTSRQAAISSAVIALTKNIGADAIVAETQTGATALQLASYRINQPIIAVTSQKRVAQQLALVYGAKGYTRPVDQYAATKLTNWLHSEKVLKKGNIVVTVSGQYPGVVGATDTIKVRVL